MNNNRPSGVRQPVSLLALGATLVSSMLWILPAAGIAATSEERTNPSVPGAVPTGSTAFCLYELPPDDTGRRRWINLGIVQHVEAKDLELRIFYGGGSFGSGYEAKLVLAKPEDAVPVLEKIRRTAAACR